MTKFDIDVEKRLLDEYLKQLNALPALNMTRKRIRNRFFYYYSEKGSTIQHLINKENVSLIEQIKHRHFLEKAISVLETNIKAQQRLLLTYLPYDSSSVNVSLKPVYRLEDTSFSNYNNTYADSCFSHYVSPGKSSSISASYDCNDKICDDSSRKHITAFGLRVRSKSEVLIAESLRAHGIHFMYELPLKLESNGKAVVIYPDFTLISGNKILYWEHMGMMSDEVYRNNAMQKIGLYAANGLTIPQNLIVTMDSANGCIDMQTINLLIYTLSF